MRETVKERGETEKLSYCRFNLFRIWRAKSAGSVPVRVQNALQAKQNVDKQKYEARRRQKATDDRKRNRFNGSRYRASHSGPSLMCVYLHSGLPIWILLHFPSILGNLLSFPTIHICPILYMYILVPLLILSFK